MKTLPSSFSRSVQNIINLFYPHLCAGCGSDLYDVHVVLCYRCLQRLPVTNFHTYAGNLVEKIFWGRLSVNAATSLCYFTKDSLVQRILHQLKYKGNKELGILMGKILGETLLLSERFSRVNVIVPLPLHPRKERIRGFNQAEVLAMGISSVTGWPINAEALQRRSFTETQTHKNRIDRWENIKGKFECLNAGALIGKHVLLVDDVITTGATLESCGTEILSIHGTQLSIATMAYANK